MTSRARVTEVLAHVRRDVTHRRIEHARRRELRRDLATYTTDAEISDLLATLEARHGAEADEVRAIVLGNMASARSAS